MIVLPHIPVELSRSRFAQSAVVTGERLDSFLETRGSLIRAGGCFDEVGPGACFGPWGASGEWGETVVVGLCGLGEDAARAEVSEADRPFWEALTGLALRDALDFLEYRVRQYLKPSGKTPGVRLVPGCEDLPLQAERAILDHFGPENSPGLSVTPSGGIDTRTGLAFVYPTDDGVRPPSRCDRCTRRDCPVRLT